MLPLLLAPSAAVTASVQQLVQNARRWAGTVVLLSSDPTKLSNAKEQLPRQFAGHDLIQLEDGWVLVGRAP